MTSIVKIGDAILRTDTQEEGWVAAANADGSVWMLHRDQATRSLVRFKLIERRVDLETVTYSLTEFEMEILQRALANVAAEDPDEGSRATATVLLERANNQVRKDWRGGEEA